MESTEQATTPVEVTDAPRKADIADLLGLNDKKKETEGEDTKTDQTPEVESKDIQGERAAAGETKPEAQSDKEKGEEEAGTTETVPDLVAELSRLSSLLSSQQENIYDILPKEEQKKEEPKKEEKQTVEKEEQKVQDMLSADSPEISSLIKDTDFEAFDEGDRKTLRNILTNVAAVARKGAIQDIMSFMPRLISYNIQGAIAAQEFWSTNPGLRALAEKQPGIRQYVTFRANEIQKNNPQMPVGQVYAQTQKEVTALLKAQLGDGAQETPVKNGGKPGLARKPGAQRGDGKSPKDQYTETQREILELM